MSLTAADTMVATPDARPPSRSLIPRQYTWLAVVLIAMVVVSTARVLSDTGNITSSGTFGVMLRTAAPVAMAGLAGLYAERSGTVNIGLEGMMVLGTFFAGWFGWYWGPWAAIAGGILGGLLGGLVHAVATATFGVNHIISGVAINLIAPGVSRFLSHLVFVDANEVGIDGGSISNSPGVSSPMWEFTMPFVSGGKIGNWKTPDVSSWLIDREWFVISDAAGLVNGITTDITLDIVIAIGLFVVSAAVIWRTPFGLRLRSAGERPTAADSLGVDVIRYRYYGMAISGGLAGFGGAIMVLFANRYQENQVAGRGFLGLASLVVGNWRPGGVAAGAGLFGYFGGLRLRTNPETLVLAVVLTAAIGLTVAVIWFTTRRQRTAGWTAAAAALAGLAVYVFTGDLSGTAIESTSAQIVFLVVVAVTLAITVLVAAEIRGPEPSVAVILISLLVAAVAYVVFVQADRPNNQIVYVMPYVVTLLVVAVRGQTSRPPAQAGIPWRKGTQL